MLVPLRKTGRLVAGMVVHQTAPRRWSHEEVELAATVVDRCWESVERTRAVRNLRQSEELYRSVIEQAEESIYLVDLDTRSDSSRPTPRSLARSATPKRSSRT